MAQAASFQLALYQRYNYERAEVFVAGLLRNFNQNDAFTALQAFQLQHDRDERLYEAFWNATLLTEAKDYVTRLNTLFLERQEQNRISQQALELARRLGVNGDIQEWATEKNDRGTLAIGLMWENQRDTWRQVHQILFVHLLNGDAMPMEQLQVAMQVVFVPGLWVDVEGPPLVQVARPAGKSLPYVLPSTRVSNTNVQWTREDGGTCAYDTMFTGLFKVPGLWLEGIVDQESIDVAPSRKDCSVGNVQNIHRHIWERMAFLRSADNFTFPRPNVCISTKEWKSCVIEDFDPSNAGGEDPRVLLAALMRFYNLESKAGLFYVQQEILKSSVDYIGKELLVFSSAVDNLIDGFNFTIPLELSTPSQPDNPWVLLSCFVNQPGHWYSFVRDVRSGKWWQFDAYRRIAEELTNEMTNEMPVSVYRASVSDKPLAWIYVKRPKDEEAQRMREEEERLRQEEIERQEAEKRRAEEERNMREQEAEAEEDRRRQEEQEQRRAEEAEQEAAETRRRQEEQERRKAEEAEEEERRKAEEEEQEKRRKAEEEERRKAEEERQQRLKTNAIYGQFPIFGGVPANVSTFNDLVNLAVQVRLRYPAEKDLLTPGPDAVYKEIVKDQYRLNGLLHAWSALLDEKLTPAQREQARIRGLARAQIEWQGEAEEQRIVESEGEEEEDVEDEPVQEQQADVEGFLASEETRRTYANKNTFDSLQGNLLTWFRSGADALEKNWDEIFKDEMKRDAIIYLWQVGKEHFIDFLNGNPDAKRKLEHAKVRAFARLQL